MRKVDGFLRKSVSSSHEGQTFFTSHLLTKKTNIMTTSSSILRPGFFLLSLIIVLLASCGSDGKKANSNAPEVDIHTAVVTDNLDALRQHIAAGTNINEKDPFGGSSPLISAAVFGKPEAARILLGAGADVNFQNNNGSTALHTAAFFCRPEIVKMLIEKGADTSIKNKYGATPYETVAGPFEESKPGYDMMGQMLGPMGLKLDYDHIRATRPVVAQMVKND